MAITYFILQHDLKARAGEVLAIDGENNTMTVFSQRLVADVYTPPPTHNILPTTHNTPTNWEQFLTLMRKGVSVREAAEELGIPTGTLCGWRARAVREGLLPPGRQPKWKKKHHHYRSEETLAAAQERGRKLVALNEARKKAGV